MNTFKDRSKAWDWKNLNKLHERPISSQELFSITFDVAVRTSDSTSAAFGRDPNGSIQYVVMEFSPSCNPHQGEGKAASNRVQETRSRQIKEIIIEGYSQKVIEALKNPHQNMDRTIEGIICDTLFTA